MRRMVIDFVRKSFDTQEAKERFRAFHDLSVDDWAAWEEKKWGVC